MDLNERDPNIGPTPGPSASLLARSKQLNRRGGGGVYTASTYGTAPPKTTYAPHTTIKGSRTSFVAVVVIAGLIFFTILGAGYWFLRRRRHARMASSSRNRRSGIFASQGRNSTSGGKGAGASGPWGRLGDHEDDDDPFAAAPSANVSMMDLHNPDGEGGNGNLHSPELGKGSYSRTFAASGESLNWQLPSLEKGEGGMGGAGGRGRGRDEEDEYDGKA